MSLHLDFEPHSWYMGFAIKREDIIADEGSRQYVWLSYTDNGMTYQVDELEADTLRELKQSIRDYHIKAKNGYGERIMARKGK